MSHERVLVRFVLPLCLAIGLTALLLLGPRLVSSRPGASAPASGPENAGFRIVGDASGNRVLLEVEAAVHIEPPFRPHLSGDPVSTAASGGACVYLGPEKVNETADNAQYATGHPAAAHPGYVALRVEVPATDEYALWVRALWVDDCGDSVDISIDGSPPRPLGGSTHGRWTWNLLRTGEGPARVRLEAGTPVEIRILNREDDLYLDQLLLLGTDRTWPEPTGIAQ